MTIDAITPRALRAALRQLAVEQAPADSPLAELAIVSRALERLGGPPSRAGRHWALGHLLSETIEAELDRRRGRAAASGAGAPAGAADGRAAAPASALAKLRLDFARDDATLEGWSTVYHLFLRPDLGLSTSGLAAVVGGRHTRTVQRRMGLGLAHLAQQLRALEAGAVAEARRLALVARLPTAAGGRLHGAESVRRAIERWLDEPDGPAVLVVTGPPGSGKSTVVAAAIRPRAEGLGAARLAWLGPSDRRPPAPTAPTAVAAPPRPRVVALRDGGPSASGARTDADERGWGAAWPDRSAAPRRPGRAAAAARAVAEACTALGGRGALVVVDGVDDGREMGTIARRFGRLAAGPRLIVTSRLGWSAFASATVLPMPPLDRAAATALVRHEGRRRGLHGVAAAADHALAAVIDATAGHPAALLLAVSELRAEAPEVVAARFRTGVGRPGRLYERMWSAAWRAAPETVRCAVAAAAQAQAGGRADLAAVAAAAGRPADDVALAVAAAADLGLVAAVDDAGGVQLPVFLSRWLARLAAG